MRSRLVTLLKIAVTVGGLIFILTQIDLGDAVAQLLRADLRWAAAALLLVMSSLVLRAYRWLLLLRGLGVNLPFARLVRLYFTGHFFNAFLPTGFGGDVVRILEVARHVPGDVAAGTVLLDRLTGLLMLFVLALVALPFRPESFPPQQAAVVLAVALVGLLAGAALLDGRLLRSAGRFLPGPLSPTGEGSVARLLRAVQAVGWPALRGALLVSLVFNLMQVSWWWAAARAGCPRRSAICCSSCRCWQSRCSCRRWAASARASVATVLFDGAVFAEEGAPGCRDRFCPVYAGLPPGAAVGIAGRAAVSVGERQAEVGRVR